MEIHFDWGQTSDGLSFSMYPSVSAQKRNFIKFGN